MVFTVTDRMQSSSQMNSYCRNTPDKNVLKLIALRQLPVWELKIPISYCESNGVYVPVFYFEQSSQAIRPGSEMIRIRNLSMYTCKLASACSMLVVYCLFTSRIAPSPTSPSRARLPGGLPMWEGARQAKINVLGDPTSSVSPSTRGRLHAYTLLLPQVLFLSFKSSFFGSTLTDLQLLE